MFESSKRCERCAFVVDVYESSERCDHCAYSKCVAHSINHVPFMASQSIIVAYIRSNDDKVPVPLYSPISHVGKGNTWALIMTLKVSLCLTTLPPQWAIQV